MIVIPVDDPKHPSKIFAIEISQPPHAQKGKEQWPTGVLIYSVDATIPTGMHPVVIYPKGNRAEGAPFHSGDTFTHEEAPFSVKVVKKQPNGEFKLEIEIKK